MNSSTARIADGHGQPIVRSISSSHEGNFPRAALGPLRR